MVTFESVTPNLLVRDMAASLRFYTEVLGFTIELKVPDEPPFVFTSVVRGGVKVFLNDLAGVTREFPEMTAGHTSTLFIVVDRVDDLFAEVSPRAQVAMALKDQFYGMREFAVFDPDGYLVTFAQPIQN
jgi:uncharacterized glyoxalase superfamily protein PhnB